MTEDEDGGGAESRRILDRVRRESGTSFFSHTAHMAGDHMAARDADQSDQIEVWGTRIGRALAVVAVLVLIGWLFSFLTRGG